MAGAPGLESLSRPCIHHEMMHYNCFTRKRPRQQDHRAAMFLSVEYQDREREQLNALQFTHQSSDSQLEAHRPNLAPDRVWVALPPFFRPIYKNNLFHTVFSPGRRERYASFV